jgi:hypothetical protein
VLVGGITELGRISSPVISIPHDRHNCAAPVIGNLIEAEQRLAMLRAGVRSI